MLDHARGQELLVNEVLHIWMTLVEEHFNQDGPLTWLAIVRLQVFYRESLYHTGVLGKKNASSLNTNTARTRLNLCVCVYVCTGEGGVYTH